MRTILYVRVSREEQVKGFSLRQQLEALREHADREGYQVVEEVEDPGFSGAELVRPGLDRVRDLVEEGGAAVVLAQDADRISREPMHRFLLDEEAERHGCRWVALDDWHDDTHEGQLLKFLKGWISKGERLKTAERTRRGSLRKVREGKLIRSRRPNYGFRYVGEKGDRYEVDEGRMAVVRRIFDEVADGTPVGAVVRALDAEGVPTPAGGRGWSRRQVTRTVGEDVYAPHAVGELRTLGVKEEVLLGLDPNALYGVWYYNRRDVESERVREDGEYRKTTTLTYRDRADWIAVPVPGAGVPRETVQRARARLAENVPLSRAGDRFWELSGGVARCAFCETNMRTRRRARGAGAGGGHLHYMVCSHGHNGGCAHRRNHRAEGLEEEVARLVDTELLSDEGALSRWMDAAGREAGRTARDPGAAERACLAQVAEVTGERDRFNRLYARGRLSDEEYDRYAAELDDREAAARAELARAHEAKGRAETLEANRRAVLEAFGAGLSLGVVWFPSELRRQVYDALGLRALVSPDGSVVLEGSFDAPAIRLTREVSEYAAALREAEERLNREESRSPATGYAAEVEEPDGMRATVLVSAESERVLRLERELARVRDARTRKPSPEAGPR